MIRGRLVLWADSPLEARVITGFLEAADYELVDVAAPGAVSQESAKFDLAIVVLDRWDSNLPEVSNRVRTFASSPSLPIIIIAMNNPGSDDQGRRVLLRPVRLFELVETVEQVINSQPRQAISNYP